MSSTAFKAQDIENAKHLIANDLEETIKFLNRCAEVSPENGEEKKKFDEYIKIAQGKGKSLVEVKQDFLLGVNKFLQATQMLLESSDSDTFLKTSIFVFDLMTESVAECWDFYSSDTRESLIKFAFAWDGSEFNRKLKNILRNIASSDEFSHLTAIEKRNILEDADKQQKAVQRFINSVTGAIDWKNCETDLGKKLFKIKEKIIMSGEPLLTSAEFDQYLEEEIENN
ncbi:hypothetical protein [Cylindrospermum sp. FACHB-282]|uniref:hypothetical protein n=1 Tax=Cylindrospermum sp. FACHB-282 TaxID=2692794 RepID=UPI001686070F|nr:hypothetical protein [Cylindrospermum sp. FACHB-282]MBD2385147.1 hypothetical protein [Cylindrospermum sp. FACHB-282]